MHLLRSAAAAALTLAFLLTPTAAHGYVPTPSAMTASSASVDAGGTVTVRVADGTFAANEGVTIDVTGAGALGAALLTGAGQGTATGPAPAGAPGATRTAGNDIVTTTIGTVPATDTGALADATIRLSTTASGPQTIRAWSMSNQVGVNVVVNITDTTAVTDTTTAVTDTTTTELATTGVDARSLLGYWIGGGALLLAGAVVTLSTYLSRHRRSRTP